MEKTLEMYLSSSKETGVDIWLATNGMIVSGHTVSMIDYFAAALKLQGQDLEKFTQRVNELLQEHPDAPASEEKSSSFILFTDATVYVAGRESYQAILAVNPELVSFWGPGILEIS